MDPSSREQWLRELRAQSPELDAAFECFELSPWREPPAGMRQIRPAGVGRRRRHPMMVVFFAFQRYFVEGIRIGGVKG